MNELLQKHGCSNVFSMPEGLKELMSDISREVLRDQPTNIYDYIANYLSALLITREHGILAVKILDDLCDCKPSLSEHLLQLGMPRADANMLAQVIKDEIVGFEPVEGREKVRETQILMKVLKQIPLDEEMVAKVCHIARNAFRDYWYRKKMLEQSLKVQPDEPWEIAAQHTLDIYKRTRPSFCELNRATQKIQAAYRGYHVRRNLLGHLKPKPKKTGPKVELPGAPIDIADSRDIDLGRVIDIKVKDDNVGVMFDDHASAGLGLKYDPMKTITHVEDEDYDEMDDIMEPSRSGRLQSRMMSTKSMNSRLLIPHEDGPKPTADELVSRESLDADDTESMGSQVPALDTSSHKISFASKTKEVIEEPSETDELLAEELPEFGEVLEVMDHFEPTEGAPDGPEIAPKGPEEAPEGPEGAPEGAEGAPVGPEGAPEGLEGAPKGPEGAPDGPEGAPEGAEGAPVGPEGEPEGFEGGPEIPEDLPEVADDHTEGDASFVSSGPPTVDDVATDVEDAADTGVSEDEGE